MGTPTHTYCSLRDLLKNQTSPKPKFKNHSYSRTRSELQDLYTNMSFDLSFPESPSLSKKVPSSQTNNVGHEKGKLCPIEKPRMVESSVGCIYNPEKSKQRFVQEKINIDPQDVMLAPNENDHLKMSFADNGAKEDVEEKEEMEKKGMVESEKEEMEKKGMVESEKKIEEKEGMLE